MSGQRFRARAKLVQKLGRDGLVEQNKTTGEEKRISQRAADISFGPDRTKEQEAGHRAVQRDGGDSASSAKKRRRQPRPIQQTAEEAVWTTQQEPDTPPVAPEPAAASMRMAVDAPMMDAPVVVEEPPPPADSRKRRKRKKRKKSKQRQAVKHTANAAHAAHPLGSQPAKAAPMRGAGDAPVQNRPPSPAPAKRPPRTAEGGGRLRFEPTECETPPVSAPEKATAARNKLKKKQVQRFAQDTAKPLVAEEHRPPRLMEDSGGRLQFEQPQDEPTLVADTERTNTARKSAKKRQIMDHSADDAKPVNTAQTEQYAATDTRAGESTPTGGAADTHSRDSPAPQTETWEFSAVPDGPNLYHRQPAAPKSDQQADTAASKPSRLQFEDTTPVEAAASTTPAAENVPPRQQKRYDQAVRCSERAEQKVEQAQENLPMKRRLTVQREPDAETGKIHHRLRFEEEIQPEYGKPSLPARVGGMAKTAAVMKLHGKIHESERENVAVEASHKGELFTEQGVGRALRWEKNRLRSKPYRALRQAEQRLSKERINLAWQTAIRENPELQKKHAFAKWAQKQQIKRKYAQAAYEAKQTFTQNVVNKTGQIVRAVAQQVAARKSVLAIAALLALVAVFFSAGLTSCTAMLSAFQSSYISASYMANEEDICNADLYFTELETDLELDIKNTESNYPGYDEYRYSFGEISHNPYELMGYLSTAFNAFTFHQVKGEIERLFHEKYVLTRTETVEDGKHILQTTLTIRRLEDIIMETLSSGEELDRYNVYQITLGNRQAYGNPFDFPWLGYVSGGYGYRVHPITGEKNLHRGVDIAAAQGTPIKAVQDGRVVSAGDAGGYGLCVVIGDDKGYQSRYAHCSSISVSPGQEVERGDVIAAVGNTGNSTGPHLHLEVMLNGEYLNPYYFVDTGDNGSGNALPGTPGGPMIPDYSGEPMGDGSFAAMLAEAEKYIGFPYVWGGSSPSTSFDCSGFVSWVINQSGVGSVGRQTVLGLQSLSTPVSAANVQPGDLVFFIGTYDAPRPGPTHIGIYVGNGQFIHCGSSGVSYASVNSNYWSSHLYGYARLN